MSITHNVSPDGLNLTSEAFINDKIVRIETRWATALEAAVNRDLAIAAAEKRFKTMSTDALQNGAANRIITLIKTNKLIIRAGFLKKNVFDKTRVTFGKHSWTADILNSRTQWNTFHKDTEYIPKSGFLVGFGGASNATFFSVTRNA